MKKIIFYLGKHSKGTFSHLISDYIKGLKKYPYEFYVIQSTNEDITFGENVNIIKIHDVKIRFQIFNLRKIINKIQPDYFVSFTAHYNFIAILLKLISRNNKTKFIISEHAIMSNKIYSEYNDNIKYRILPILMKFYRYSDGLFCVSNGVYDDLRYRFKIKMPKITITLYNPVDSDRIIKKSQENADIQLNKDSFNYITIGRICKQKNYPLMLHAFQKLILTGVQNVHLYILGLDEGEINLSRMIGELELEKYVTHLGFIDNPYSILRQADCFILSSIEEAFGLVICEALVLKKIVICTDAIGGGPRDILGKSEFGLLTKNNNIQEFQSALMNVIDNNEILTKKYCSKKRYSEFSVDYIGDKMNNFLIEVSK